MILKITVLLLNYIPIKIIGIAPILMILEITVLLLNYILILSTGKDLDLQPLTYQVSAPPIELPVNWAQRDLNPQTFDLQNQHSTKLNYKPFVKYRIQTYA
jgi:hypothetical protein